MSGIPRKIRPFIFRPGKSGTFTLKRRSLIIGLGLVAALFLAACGGDGSELTDYQKACQYCMEQGGTVEPATDDNGNAIDICKRQEMMTGDDGEQTATIECELQAFYEGRCDDSPGDDGAYEAPPLVGGCPTCPKTVREIFNDQVDDILLKLDNTGYSHRPFSLDPNYTSLAQQTAAAPIDDYDLFLDCSGFVGYYVIQGVAESLYKKIPRCYSCGSLEEEAGVTTPVARPLAADFYDLFKNSPVYAGQEATADDDLCWSRVEHISDARPGDVIVYLHPDNLDLDTKYCCYKDGPVYKTKEVADESACSEGRIIYKAKKDSRGRTKNTGHVLFVHDYPYRSTEKKDNSGVYQWVVEVADSTTSPHMFDSRKKGEGNSVYGPNYYHAWSRGDDGYVQKCADGSYHRDCSAHGTGQTGGNIEINTSHDYATGIGVGRMYVNDDMSGYRTSYSHATDDAEVVIGRPVPCP